ncbi:DUF3626 domain-containing protein [Paenibacillus lupini]|uniref:DUF3626 domain-containing protein n=1 Tax=Paenibacillus lupini TaxID=1450204 RepID=UPI00141E75A1|nr:DUF3626 domain-containing protein [Paenibacillus lupini]NIK21900.1 hypothetical protein [Paenibacillus lupini]
MSTERRLTNSQTMAYQHISQYASIRRAAAQESIREILQLSNIPFEIFEAYVSKLHSQARVAMHFHPDRPIADMKSVAEALLEQGIYKSQFETQISNGSVSAFPGGARDVWERDLFGGAYQLAGVTHSERPKYGALDVMYHSDGPSPRFGSCYFLLTLQASYRTTFTYGGSQDYPVVQGTFQEFDDIIAAVLKDAFFREFTLGESNLSPRKVLDRLLNASESLITNRLEQMPSRNLNYFIEAQVHGDITLQDDVDILVADPSFQRTVVGNTLEKLCMKYSIDLHWHKGFTIQADEVPSDFRGPAMPSLARRIARENLIDASIVGAAVNDLKRNADHWSDRGTYEEVLQELKYMWHVLVRYGKPAQQTRLENV